MKTKAVQKLEDIKKVKATSDECRENILQTQNQQLKYIDEEFDRIISRIMARKEALKISYQDYCQEEIDLLQKEITKVETSMQDLTKNTEELNKYVERLGNSLIHK